MKRILIIEDDPEIAELLRLELEEAGFQVDWAPSGMRGLVRLREGRPDLVILDLGLPDLDGAEVARRIRATGDTPILVLTAQDAVDRKVSLLLEGADDYMVKPFHPKELLARVQVQLRNREGSEVLSAGGLELYPRKRLVRFQDREVRLSPKEFDLLHLLLSRPGRVFSRQEIEERLWGRPLEKDSNLVDVHVANLRAKLREAGAYGYLRTVRGVGYAIRPRE
ncbi:response regulator transcription factor [Thermus filiformis]|uniref:Transcriptional regulator n=1 Tax=Thermus filiformis TaxID=276 RepID=A0A0A2X8B1_THEFI|nr:response regulator transcription factor [Thermus filiformis]KGQ21469.1 transcriptional regulator [Thermus filiformis]